MNIVFRPYTKKNGEVMLYINRSNGVSVGVSAAERFYPYGVGSTQGKRNAYEAACRVIKKAPVFTGDLGALAPGQSFQPLANGWVVAVTDTAELGGEKLMSNGAYVVAGNRILRCGLAYEEEEEG